MFIKYVTLTGADDSIAPSDLIPLTEKYPFVEWGILFSQNKSGVERYPSLYWVDSLVDSVAATHKINLAAHLCGKWADDALKGEITFLRDDRYRRAFQRIQLNLGKDRLKTAIGSEDLRRAKEVVKQQVMLGGNYGVVRPDPDYFIRARVSPLFDASGGRGILTLNWPKPLEYSQCKLFCGYAGGLGPDNIADELKRIEEVVGDGHIWIDMESRLRTGEKFDLEKCERVLQVAQQYVG